MLSPVTGCVIRQESDRTIIEPRAHNGVPADVRKLATELRAVVTQAVGRHPATCMLLSGGLDTSALAPIAAKEGTRLAVTVLASADAPDRPYAAAVAARLGWRHRLVDVSFEELLTETEFVVRVLRTFDPMEIRNSIVISRGLREAANLGVETVMTGDAADELFGGYSFMWSKPDEEFETYSRRMAETMHFSSAPLGTALGLEVRAPYTDPDVVRFAGGLPKRLKVGVRNGMTFGKWVLRWAFPESEACWRRKDPIEVGSGTARLPEYFTNRIPPYEVAAERHRIAREDCVEIRDAEHLAYYRVFRDVFGPDPLTGRFGENSCAKCGFGLPHPDSTFCITCGAYPARA